MTMVTTKCICFVRCVQSTDNESEINIFSEDAARLHNYPPKKQTFVYLLIN